jgi:hypothetical protein
LKPISVERPPDNSCPSGVITIAVVCILAATYLVVIGLTLIVAPGTFPLRLGAPLLDGLELAGPYMFLLIGGLGVLIGWGLLRLNNWARWAAILAALAGVVMLVPSVSGAVVYFALGKLAWEGLGIMVRVAMIWYLCQEPVVEQFRK